MTIKPTTWDFNKFKTFANCFLQNGFQQMVVAEGCHIYIAPDAFIYTFFLLSPMTTVWNRFIISVSFTEIKVEVQRV